MSKVAGYFQYYNATDRIPKIKGCDIAHYQYPVNFTTMKTQGDFVFFKSGGVYRNTFSAKYIRVSTTGSNVNTRAIFNEIKVYSIDNLGNVTERATGKPVTGSRSPSPLAGEYSYFTDDDINTNVVVGDGYQWVQVELDAVYNIHYIRLYMYFTDKRKFQNKKIEYSTDGLTYTTLYDSAINGEMAEDSEGMVIQLYGGMSQDPQFTTANLNSARTSGLKVGFYWFKNPNYNDPVNGWHTTVAYAESEATQFYNYILSVTGSANDIGDLIPMLDFENNLGTIYPSMSNDVAYNFIEAFINKFKVLSGRQCILYTAYYTCDNLTAGAHDELVHSTKGGIYQKCPLWLAARAPDIYGGSYPNYNYTSFGGYPTELWSIWQFSSDGNGQGSTWGVSSANIDLDITEGDLYSIMPPSKVTGLTATAGNTQVVLNWSAIPDTDKTGYKIYKNGTLLTTVSNSTITYTATGLTNGTTYSFNVSATDTWDEGLKSTAATATPVSPVDYFQYYTSSQRTSMVLGADISARDYPINYATMKTKGSFVIQEAGLTTRSTFNARYIKISANGNTINASSVFCELKVFDNTGSGTNLALGKTVTASQTPDFNPLTNFTDGNKTTYVVVGDGLQWVKVDLDSVVTIDYLQLFMYYFDGRAFHGKKIEYSTDDLTYTTLFDSAVSGEKAETIDGMIIMLYNNISQDAQFTTVNLNSAKSAGLKLGFYWNKNPNYHKPSTGWKNTITDAETEAQAFYNYIIAVTGSSTDTGEFLPVLAFKNDYGSIYPSCSNDEAYNYIEAFVNKFRTLSGRQVILATFYGSVAGLSSTAGQQLIHSTKGAISQVCPIWLIAQDLNSYPTTDFTAFGGYLNNKWLAWQYSAEGNGLGSSWGLTYADIDLHTLDGDIYTLMRPSKIVDVVSLAGDTTALLAWDSPPDTDLLNIKVYKNNILLDTLAKTATSYEATGLTNGTPYTFNISAIDKWEEGNKSDSVVVTPAVPTVNVTPRAGKKAKILVYGSSIAFTDEATITTDNTTYQITNINKRIWYQNGTITVKNGGVATIESYTLDRLTGRITFTTSTSRTITVSGEYLPTASVGQAYEYTWTCSGDNLDATYFGNEFIVRKQGLKDFSANISKFYDTDNYFFNKLQTDGQYVLEFYSLGSSTPDIRAWTKISNDEDSGSVDALNEESIDFEGVNDADNRSISFGPF